MSKYFSKTTGGFYDTVIYRLSTDENSVDENMPVMPSDVVAVTDEEYAELFAAQASGAVISAAQNGSPQAIVPTQTAGQIAQNAAAEAIDAGLTINSTGTPAINGVYGCDAVSVANFNAIETYVLRNNTFPGPSNTQPWVQKNNNVVLIPNTTVFNEMASALANYVALVQVYAYSNGQSGSLPSSSVTIA